VSNPRPKSAPSGYIFHGLTMSVSPGTKGESLVRPIPIDKFEHRL
jgi:hypothetical protein